MFFNLEINSNPYVLPVGISVLEACELVGIDIPRFCYSQTLSVAGNCRLCLVEIAGAPKAVASCALPISAEMKIFTDSVLVKKARENVVEFLLLSHPLDCPICDQGGECDLQDQSRLFGLANSRFFYHKRIVEDKNVSPVIKTIMTRCIHCTRCVRYNSEISGGEFFGTLNRGSSTEIGSYFPTSLLSDVQSNVIDLCPVGALTSKPYTFKARPWELQTQESIDLTDGLGSSIYVGLKEMEILRVFPKANPKVNGLVISDRARFVYEANQLNRAPLTLVSKQRLQAHFSVSSVFKNKKTLFLVSNYGDLDLLSYAKQLENASGKPTFFNSGAFNLAYRGNGYCSWVGNTLASLTSINQVCFILGSQLQLENSILNLKLRLKQKRANLRVFGCCLNSKDMFMTEFINLNVLYLFCFLEAKLEMLSTVLMQFLTPLIFIGEPLSKRVGRLLQFMLFLKRVVPSVVLFNVQISSNLAGLSFLNIKTLNSRLVDNASNVFFCDLSDSYFLKRLLLNSKKNIFWYNTHKTDILVDDNSTLHFTCPTEYETEQVHINIEERIQKTSVILSKRDLNLRNKIQLLLVEVGLPVWESSVSFGRAVTEFLVESAVTISALMPDIGSLGLVGLQIEDTVSLYPLKTLNENFNSGTKMLQNARTLVLNSRLVREFDNNFN